ncbi:Glutaredoxin-like domain [Marinobacter daqiaonensis]|uniref:Glutaredoxin-like domain n=1 Tax=Marinobacter daqiaonensis TaxID=650891 RepID=A0A1I6JI97_9GAMM|nr:glutaredoxin family protein [Marinobacter daqiaonensis]SFR78614.1 Glutaredoxin-like domain [Marinobacter daqiaonensis]
MQLTFFTTSHCELCDLAEALLVNTPLPHPVPVEAVDIASSAELVERYGTRIPVLRREDNGAEMGWPFTRDDLLDFLAPGPSTTSGRLH